VETQTYRITSKRFASLSAVAPAVSVLLFAFLRPASAQQYYSQDELRALPRVCLAQQFINDALRAPIVPEAERREWSARLGEGYKHYHHYCWALMDLRRGNTGPPQHRQSSYSEAVRNLEYVQRNAPSTFPMLPEVCLRKGMALRYLGNEGGAAREFLDAIEIKRDYTPAYSALIDLYVDLKDYDAARTVLERGLAMVPDSHILATKKAEIQKRIASPP